MLELGSLALDLIINLLAGVIQETVKYNDLPFFERRRIERRIEDAIAEAVEPLLPLLTQERIPQDKQVRLLQTCVEELRPLAHNPERLFGGSLDGQKIFEQLYADRDLPEVVVEDGVADVYTLLFPRVATLLCRIPAAVKDWENEAWSENFRRLDELTAQLTNVFDTVDQLASLPTRHADETLSQVRRSLAQKVLLELDLTGLRADRPLAGKFDDFFVHPAMKREPKPGIEPVQLLGAPDATFARFTHPGSRTSIVGAAGAGKSTWARWLQREALTVHRSGISIRIELRQLSGDSLPSLHQLVREASGKHLAENITAERIGRWLSTERILFILDGFDEIRPDLRDAVHDWLVDLQSAARSCPFVLTSRPLTTSHLSRLVEAGWHEWTIEPFDRPRIIDYIGRWHANTPVLADANRRIDAEVLADRWLDDPTIEPLTGNPLLLSTLLMVHHLDGSLPTGRSNLYKRYVEGMLGLWDDRREVLAANVVLSLEIKRQILRGFALKLFLGEVEQMDEHEVLAWLRDLLQAMRLSVSEPDVLAVLRERSGLIVGPGTYSFAHKTIAEFFVAEAVLQGDQRDASGARVDRFLLYENRENDRWNSVTFLWAGLAPLADVESFIEQCLKAESWALAYGLLFDQYARFPLNIRREVILRIHVQKQYSLLSTSGMWWMCSAPNASCNDDMLSVPTFTLRSIGRIAYFHYVVMKAVEDGTVVFSDFSDAEQDWKNLLWMCFALTLFQHDMEDWKACISSYSPPNSLKIRWQYWVVERAVFAILESADKLDVHALLAAYKEVIPEAKGAIPFALMSVGMAVLLPNTSQFFDSPLIISESLKTLLAYLPDKEDVPPEWLIWSRGWGLPWTTGSPDVVVDLLADFISALEGKVEEGLLDRDATYERAMMYIQRQKEISEDLRAPDPASETTSGSGI